MNFEEIKKFLQLNSFRSSKDSKWKSLFPESEFWTNKKLALELNKRSRYIKRLDTYELVYYCDGNLDKIKNLLDIK